MNEGNQVCVARIESVPEGKQYTTLSTFIRTLSLSILALLSTDTPSSNP